MPGGFSHYQLALEVARELEARGIPYDRGTLLFGAQAPDVFYGYRFWRRGNNLGVLLHRASSEALFSEFRVCSEDLAADSFVYGYLTHYAFDVLVHPYVNFLSKRYENIEERRRKSKFHYRIEADLDTFLAENRYGNRDPGFRFECESRLPETSFESVFRLMERVVSERFGMELTREAFRRCERHYLRFQQYRRDPSYRKRKILYGAENLFRLSHRSSFLIAREHPDEQVLNLGHAEWETGEGDRSREDFFQLFDRVKEFSVQLIESFRGGRVDRSFGRHLLTGKISEKTDENI